jgi:hypothetical protein
MAPSAPSRPPGRYDDRGGRLRPGLVAVVVVVVAAFVGWVLWAALGAATPDVRSELRGFEVRSATRVTADLQIVADARRPVTCTVQAEDRNRDPVGIARTTLPAGEDATRRATVGIRTRSRAVTVVISGCRLDRPTG